MEKAFCLLSDSPVILSDSFTRPILISMLRSNYIIIVITINKRLITNRLGLTEHNSTLVQKTSLVKIDKPETKRFNRTCIILIVFFYSKNKPSIYIYIIEQSIFFLGVFHTRCKVLAFHFFVRCKRNSDRFLSREILDHKKSASVSNTFVREK